MLGEEEEKVEVRVRGRVMYVSRYGEGKVVERECKHRERLHDLQIKGQKKMHRKSGNNTHAQIIAL